MAYHTRSAQSEDVVTPELALIDPVLAERARSRLEEAGDTVARLELLIRTNRTAALARQSLEAPARRVPDISESTRRISRLGQRQSAALAGGIAAGTLVIVLLLGVHVDLRGTPAGADIAPVDELPVQSLPRKPNAGDKTFSTPRAGQRPRATKPTPQRFAWAPAADASAYHVELFRGSLKVFEADTKTTAITVPTRWVFGQQSQRLEPGDYRWYVWPLVSGRRTARAIVQARLAVPPG